MGLRKLRLKKIVTNVTTMCTRMVILFLIVEVILFESNYQSILMNTIKLRHRVVQAISKQYIYFTFLYSQTSWNFLS